MLNNELPNITAVSDRTYNNFKYLKLCIEYNWCYIGYYLKTLSVTRLLRVAACPPPCGFDHKMAITPTKIIRWR